MDPGNHETFMQLRASSILLIGAICCWGAAAPSKQASAEDAIHPVMQYEPHILGDQYCKRLYQLARDVQHVMDLCQIEFYFSSGTLLGAVRHKGLIPWDDDLDLCMLAQYQNVFTTKAIPQLQALGWQVVEFSNGWKGYKIKEKILSEGVCSPFCDVFLVIEKNGYCRYAGRWPWMVLRSDQVRPIGKLLFGDVQISVPHDYPDFLDQNFGSSWRSEAIKYNHENLKHNLKHRYRPAQKLWPKVRRPHVEKVTPYTGPFLPAGPFSDPD